MSSDCPQQGTYTLGRFLAHASILCTVMGADQNKESFLYPGVGSTVYVIVPPRNQRTHSTDRVLADLKIYPDLSTHYLLGKIVLKNIFFI